MKVHLNNDIEKSTILDDFDICGDKFKLCINGKNTEFTFQLLDSNTLRIFKDGKNHLCYFNKSKNFTEVFIEGCYFKVELSKLGEVKESTDDELKTLEYVSPMPGKISKIEVKIGTKVKKGDVLVYLEAMKMEHPIKSKIDGIVDIIEVNLGNQVAQGQKLVKLKNV